MSLDVTYRYINKKDINGIIVNFTEQGWEKPRSIIENYVLEQESNERVVIVAEIADQIAGYVTLLPKAKDAVPFIERGIPEIKDLVVFKKYQSQGIGNQLLACIEKEAALLTDEICLSVGLHKGYGAAQRLYIKRGYIPDGTGIWSGHTQAPPYAMIENNDDLIICLSKKLVRFPH